MRRASATSSARSPTWRARSRGKVAADAKTKVIVKPEDAGGRTSGPARFDYGELDAEDQIGMATGLVVSDAGGDIVQVEATKMDGKDDFILTGQLGDVMKESARAGMSLHPGAHEGARASTPTPSRRRRSTSTSRPGRLPRTARRPA